MVTNRPFSRRRFLQTSAMLTAGGVLAACAAPVAPAAQPAGGSEAAAPAGELIELSYMTARSRARESHQRSAGQWL